MGLEEGAADVACGDSFTTVLRDDGQVRGDDYYYYDYYDYCSCNSL